jgi:hypothetical protein
LYYNGLVTSHLKAADDAQEQGASRKKSAAYPEGEPFEEAHNAVTGRQMNF